MKFENVSQVDLRLETNALLESAGVSQEPGPWKPPTWKQCQQTGCFQYKGKSHLHPWSAWWLHG